MIIILAKAHVCMHIRTEDFGVSSVERLKTMAIKLSDFLFYFFPPG